MDSDFEAIDMAKCLMQLSESGNKKKKKKEEEQSYECRTCRKSFSSFQALGGHRASHSSHHPERAQEHRKRRFKEQGRDDDSTKMRFKSRSYKCSMCESVFSSGQALGGHMRKHRPLAPDCAGFSSATVSFDLNFPPLEESADQF